MSGDYHTILHTAVEYSKFLSGNSASLFRLSSPPRESGKYSNDFIHASHGKIFSSNVFNFCRDVAVSVRCIGPVSNLNSALLALA